jgi:hypothetical protein
VRDIQNRVVKESGTIADIRRANPHLYRPLCRRGSSFEEIASPVAFYYPRFCEILRKFDAFAFAAFRGWKTYVAWSTNLIKRISGILKHKSLFASFFINI